MIRLPLTTIEIFNAIAEAGSLKGAADRLGIKPSTVSHQLRALEDRLGAALFIRTTRSISLTEAGRALLRGTAPAFEQISDAVEAAQTTGHAARGALRLAMPEFVYHLFVAPKLQSFCAAYPEIELELSISDALSDILGEEFHAGFRLGDRIAQDMVAVRMTQPLPLAVVGSPDYLQRYGKPDRPRDLLEHNCVRYRFLSSGMIAPWSFDAPDGAYSVEVKGQLIANSLPASIDIALQGLGLVYTFRDYCEPHLADVRLVPLLEKDLPVTPGVFLYFPREYRSMTPLRLLLDHLQS